MMARSMLMRPNSPTASPRRRIPYPSMARQAKIRGRVEQNSTKNMLRFFSGIEIAHKHFASAVEGDFTMDGRDGNIRNAVIVALSATDSIGACLQGKDSAFGNSGLNLQDGHTRSL